jgi:hypothetical protein
MRERDVWNTTIYHRAIRKKIGEALSAAYDLSQPLAWRPPALLRREELCCVAAPGSVCPFDTTYLTLSSSRAGIGRAVTSANICFTPVPY